MWVSPDVRDDSRLVLATLKVRIREEEEDLFQLRAEKKGLAEPFRVA